jgi:hypothetical protein
MTDGSNNRDFNVFHEIARGALYRGGESMENYLRGYVWGVLIVAFIVAVKILPVILGNLADGRGILGGGPL